MLQRMVLQSRSVCGSPAPLLVKLESWWCPFCRLGSGHAVSSTALGVRNIRFLFFFFLNFWLCWVFIAVHGLSLDVVSASLQCLAFSRWWILLSQSAGLGCAGLSSFGPWAQLPPSTETSGSLLLLLLFLIKIDLPT